MAEPDDSDSDRKDFKPLKKSKHHGVKDWENVVKVIETVELQDKQLFCFFTT